MLPIGSVLLQKTSQMSCTTLPLTSHWPALNHKGGQESIAIDLGTLLCQINIETAMKEDIELET